MVNKIKITSIRDFFTNYKKMGLYIFFFKFQKMFSNIQKKRLNFKNL